jgi:hypothetical protein
MQARIEDEAGNSQNSFGGEKIATAHRPAFKHEPPRQAISPAFI